MRFVALLVAAIVAVVAGVAILKMSGGTPSNANPQSNAANQSVPVSTSQVLVARQPIEVGTIIEDSMIDKQPWPSHLVLDGFITAGTETANLSGKVARASFQAGEPIMSSKIANPNDPSFLAAGLPEGMRAVTVATDAISGVAGYVFPGDHVDIILTHNIPNDIKTRIDKTVSVVNKPDVAEILVPDVRVLAVNVRQPSGKEASTSTPSSVTLAVSEPDAQAIRLAEKVGTLSLALRPLKDDPTKEPHPTTSSALTQVKIYGGQATGGVRVIRGAGEKAETQANKVQGNSVWNANGEATTNDVRN